VSGDGEGNEWRRGQAMAWADDDGPSDPVGDGWQWAGGMDERRCGQPTATSQGM
jgi:hypothetical protein